MVEWAPKVWDLVLTVLGGAIAAASGLALVWYSRKRDRDDKRKFLAVGLEGELSVIAELLDIDLQIDHLDASNVPDGLGKIERIRAARTVFDSASLTLAHLPDPIPGSLVRFYGRLGAKADEMEQYLRIGNFFTKVNGQWANLPARERYEGAQRLLSTEVESLRRDIQDALS